MVRGVRLARGMLLLAGAAVLTSLLLSAESTPTARAAPCPAPSVVMDGTGNLAIQGTSPCSDDPELISPFCSAGTVFFDYTVNGSNIGPDSTGIACGAPTRLSLFGNGGDDTLDLSRASADNGFAGINQPNALDGGSGADTLVSGPFPAIARGGPENDVLLLRNGVSDMANCGTGIDAVQTDQPGVDSLANCEIVDFLPASPVPVPLPGPTGQRAAALKKCKHKHGHARKKCKRKANLLPV